MTTDQGEVVVRDLGSTNGIRINGQRVEMGRLRPGDELSIAHIRYRLDTSHEAEMTMADAHPKVVPPISPNSVAIAPSTTPVESSPFPSSSNEENPLAAAVRELLPAGVADRCRIQVIVQMPNEANGPEK
jgi:pSer/pThr/pTyr-binding forkhead associated (FHA) protein